VSRRRSQKRSEKNVVAMIVMETKMKADWEKIIIRAEVEAEHEVGMGS
jgi:hypothetical protein